MKASCTGCSFPSCAMPSIVSTCRPSQAIASVMHEYAVRPSMRTVHAPQSPSLQTFFVPVSPSESRSVSSRERCGGTWTEVILPLTERERSTAFGPRNEAIASDGTVQPESSEEGLCPDERGRHRAQARRRSDGCEADGEEPRRGENAVAIQKVGIV